MKVGKDTLGTTTHWDRVFAVSKGWEAAAAMAPENPAARLEARGETGPTSLIDLNNIKIGLD